LDLRCRANLYLNAAASFKAPKRTITQEISTCRKIIQEGLGKRVVSYIKSMFIFYITDAILATHGVSDKVIMNYANYERKVVELWGMVLEGWPEGKVANPGSLHSRQRVQALLKALEEGRCGWIKLTDEALEQRIIDNKAREAAGEEIYKPHKKPAKKPIADNIGDSDEN
jgi:hypothetical protein